MNFPRADNNEAITARAATWLARRDDALTAAEAVEFATWRAADPRHEAAVARLETTWALLQQLGAYRPGARAHPDCDVLAPPPPRLHRWIVPVLAAAAVVTVMLLGAWAWNARPAAPTATATAPSYTTTPGGYQRLTLADGSVVELNTDSEVRVRYTADERRIELTRGQAHFIVAKNPGRPFWVETGAVAVRAVGTAFDVRRHASEVQVVVTAGTVELAQENSRAPRPRLSAGWRAVLDDRGDQAPRIEEVSRVELRTALAWHGTRLTFVETPLAEVVQQFNRRNDVQLALGDAALGAMPVGGSFSADNLEAFVRLLASNGDIVVERPAANRILLRRAP